MGLHVAYLTYHFYNHTAEGLVAAKAACALQDSGHDVTVFAAPADTHRPDNGVVPPMLRSIQLEPVMNETEGGPWWWRTSMRVARRYPAADKIAAIGNLRYACTPTERGWIVAAASAIEAVHRKVPFDVLLSRLNPHVSHLAGLELVRRVPSLPWCAYFSDPWPYHLYPEPYDFTVGRLARYRHEAILDRILDRAGSSVFPSERLRDHMLRQCRARFLPRSFVVPHLANFMEEAAPPATGDRLSIRHAGFLMRERRIADLYAALRRLRRDTPGAAEDLCIEFAGRYPGNEVPEPPEDLADLVYFHPNIPPDRVWAWMQAAHVFLLVEAQMTEGIFFPSKLADYLGGRRPILALSPQVGVVADLLGDRTGLRVEPTDAEGIAAALRSLRARWRAGRLETLVPSDEQVRTVFPERVVPLYEQALTCAIENQQIGAS